MYPCDVISGWAAKEVRGLVGRWILFIKEEVTNEVIKVHLTDMLPECLE